MVITAQEEKVIEILRELRPFERIEITKDQLGRPDKFLVHRSQKIIIEEVVHMYTS